MPVVYLWIVAGICLFVLEVLFPIGFEAAMMGISAFITAGIALILPNVTAQAICWLIMSVVLIILARRFVPLRSAHLKIEDAVDGKCITAIPAGDSGRVLYEGNSWRAECPDPQLAIAKGEKVYVVNRQGNTLFVYPANELFAEKYLRPQTPELPPDQDLG